MESQVSTPNAVYTSLKPKWDRCRDVSKGSDAIKAGGVKYLPALDSHKRENNLERNDWLTGGRYEEYKRRALFYNATARTIEGLAGSIFQRAPSVKAAAAERDIKDISLTGEPLEMFSLFTVKEFLITGKLGILVDMSSEEATTPRPYWVGYEAENIINWRFQRLGGDAKLVLVVLKETIEDINPEDEFDSKPQVQYRVLRLENGVYSQEIYSLMPGEGNKTEFIGGGRTIPLRRGQPLNFIPFATPWTHNIPPLLDLVDVNLSHYRASADLKHGLHFTALPTPWVSGQKGGDSSKPLSMGSGVAWDLDVNGRAGMLEFSGRGLGAIRNDMKDMEQMMSTLGARLLETPTRSETALSVAIRHSSDFASLKTIAQIVEQQLTYALKIHDWWLGSQKLVTDSLADIQLNKMFIDQSVTADELRALILALQGGTISYETFYERLANSGWTREGVTSEMELEAIQTDGDSFKVVKTPAPGGPTIPGAPEEPELEPLAGQLPTEAMTPRGIKRK